MKLLTIEDLPIVVEEGNMIATQLEIGREYSFGGEAAYPIEIEIWHIPTTKLYFFQFPGGRSIMYLLGMIEEVENSTKKEALKRRYCFYSPTQMYPLQVVKLRNGAYELWTFEKGSSQGGVG